MQRQIKFRAWHIQRKKMEICWSLYWFEENSITEVPAEGWQVMQFTGLTDKSGKPIFEGDIIALHRGDGCHVYQMDDPNKDMRTIAYGDAGQPCLMLMDGREQGSGLTWCKNNAEKCFEVIGNIHENPELLEQKQ